MLTDKDVMFCKYALQTFESGEFSIEGKDAIALGGTYQWLKDLPEKLVKIREEMEGLNAENVQLQAKLKEAEAKKTQTKKVRKKRV